MNMLLTASPVISSLGDFCMKSMSREQNVLRHFWKLCAIKDALTFQGDDDSTYATVVKYGMSISVCASLLTVSQLDYKWVALMQIHMPQLAQSGCQLEGGGKGVCGGRGGRGRGGHGGL